MMVLNKEGVSLKHSEKQAAMYTRKILLNCYIRECCYENPQLLTINQQEKTFFLYFKASNQTVKGKFSFYSANGEHEYEYCKLHDGQDLSYLHLVSLIIQELQQQGFAITLERACDFINRVNNSYQNMTIFLEQTANELVIDYITSEQSLLYGHPFHPYPKNTVGFTPGEVKKFCPELRTSFSLCYVAVRNDVFQEEWITQEAAHQFSNQLDAYVRHKFDKSYEDYRILPVHPWQYKYVQNIDVVRDYERQKKIIFLGSFGPKCYPTSSVRTVFIPEMKCNIKLSLSIQITNMIRNNSQKQMRRTIDAANYLLANDCFQEELHTKVMYETGICTCCFEDEQLTKLFTIAYRPVEFDETSTYVVASLLEAPIQGEPSRLYGWIKEQNIDVWFRDYLAISLLPIVQLAEEKGIHFEAHLQNSLVTLKNGQPQVFWIRDLEGVSIEKGKVGTNVKAIGPLFYEKEQAWARTKYYFMVNHLGSFIHALARDFKRDELYFWQIVQDVLMQEWRSTKSEFITHLLTTPVFYAKNNLISCLIGKSEIPSYVRVNNLMCREDEKGGDHDKFI